MATRPLIEWREFIKRGHLIPPRTARVGKRWIESGQIKGRIIGGRPYVDIEAWEAGDTSPDSTPNLQVQRLLA